ncbi:MAG TPA: TonB-dependent receptor [Bryobacteraceae bacterium]|nr:TonB-dependent receptor [Bryobacteraceae bacterium]
MWCLSLLLLTSVMLLGQAGTEGSILGTVQDATGAMVPQAQVTVTNLATGLKRTAVSDGTGNFEVLALPVGPYSVSVTAPGFKTWSLTRTEITVGERSRIAPVLEVGQVSEQVTVEATAEVLQTERSSVETVVQMQQIRELPLSTRNPVVLVNLVPGMRYLSTGGPERGSTVQGFGTRDNQTQFQLDGLSANAAMDEGGMAIPNVDTIAEFNVQTNSFSAENGRNPLQVLVVTKSGTNEFHGALWEFLQNDALNARNTFATSIPKVRRNQFGAAIGGPIFRNKTFFFASFEGTPIRGASIYNSVVPSAAMKRGDFSALSTPIRDPQTGQPFRGNVIPADRISSASQFFLPYVLEPNSPDGRFRALAATKNDTWEGTARIDHQITNNQRIYGRWVVVDNLAQSPGYSPQIVSDNTTRQHNVGLNYTNMISPSLLLTATAGYLRSDNRFTWPLAGIENLTQQAGIRGIRTEGREEFVGLPNVGITGYTGFSAPWGVPGRLWSTVRNAKISLNNVRSAHTLSFGYEFDDRAVYGRHGSHSPRGSFDFNGQFTGNGFADYMLGLTSGSRRNFPLESFGLENAPYSGIWAQDYWKVTPNLTINLGLRYERWHEHDLKNGNGATFDPKIGKVIAGVDDNGQMNLNAQPVAPYLSAATQGLWVPATEVNVPRGLYEANGNWSPRLGVTWRPLDTANFVVRGGYGLFYNTFTGNRAASSIVGPPYWAWEALSFSALSLQRWETAWPADPQAFIQPSIGEAPAFNIRPAKTHEFNVSVQTALPFKSALTLSYVGTRLRDQVSMHAYNEVAPGRHPNLQAAKPWPVFGTVNVLENLGKSWYNGMQVKIERRYADGLSAMLSYSFAKDISDMTPSGEYDALVPFAPPGYLRGRSGHDRTHILFANVVWELPFGRGRKWGSDLTKAADLLLGGWQLSGINSFTSGSPLTFTAPGATLGNGWNTRPNLVGDPSISNPNRDMWFNPAAFAAPAQYQWGNSGIGIIDGPAVHILDAGLMKNFHVTESKYFQFRWEAFNAFNHVNLNNPGTTLGRSNFGKILSARAARTMQLGLKFLF